MDFGISLDPLAVPQRHALYDSESEEEGEQETQSESEVFRVDKIGEDGEFLAGKALLLALGNTASVFAKSFIRIREEPFLSLRTDVSRVKSNSPRGKGAEDVTHFYYSQEESSKWAVCLHAAELQAEHCNHWADKVGSGSYFSHILTFFCEQVFDCGQPNKVVVFVCRSQHEHFSVIGSCGDTAHLMRSLQSSSWPHPPPLGMQLEPPNTLQGEAAASETLTHPSHLSFPFLHYVYNGLSE